MSKTNKQLFDEGRRKVLEEKLKFIYSKIPSVKCKGHCHPFCSAIGLESVEVENIENHHSKFPTGFRMPDDSIRCGSLTVENRCSVYDTRPMICRMFGVTEMMIECPIGCELENGERKLTHHEVFTLFTELKLFNLGYYYPKKLQHLQEIDEKKLKYNIGDYILESHYNVPEELWQLDINSEYRKTEKTLKEFNQVSDIDMNQWKREKQENLIKVLREKLKTNNSQIISIYNSDNMKEYDFDRNFIESKTDDELFQFLFIEGELSK